MKKIYTLLLIAMPFLAHTQTIQQSDLPNAGDAWTMNHDTTYTAAIPGGGTGQTWNYSGLLTNQVDTQAFQAAAGTPYASTFPSSNLAMLNTTDGSYQYFSNTSTGFYFDGFSDGVTNAIYNPSMLFIPVPFSFGSTTSSVGRLTIDTSNSGQNFRLVVRNEITFNGDATGSLTTPTGMFNVLRIRTTQLTYDSILVELSPGTGIYIPFSGSASQTTTYNFVSSGNPVNLIMTLDADSLGNNATQSSYFSGQVTLNTPELTKAKKVVAYPNPAYDKIKFNSSDLNAQLIIYDNSGQEVSRFNGNIGNSVDVQKMTAGVYHYKVIYKDRTETGNFVVQH